MFGFLYVTTNLLNQKRYVGMCKYSRPNHRTYLGSGKAIKRAIKKHSNSNFSREVIFEAETREELLRKEASFIEENNCVKDTSWYNLIPGGFATRGFSGRKHSAETKALMSKNHKQPLTEDSKRRISEANKARGGFKAASEKLLTCPYCNTVGSSGPMTRWHFNRCKTLKAD